MDKQSHDGNRRPEFIDLLIPWRRRQVGDSWQELLAPSVITDKLDYRPGETAMITASGFRPGETITFTIADDPQDPGDDGDADLYQPFSVKDGGAGDLDGIANGQVVTSWFVPTDDDGSGSGTPDALNASLILTALGSKGQTAQVLFTDSGATVVTDKADYAPGETVTITASGFAVGSTIEFAIADDPSDPGDDGNADVYAPFAVTDGGAGDLDGSPNGQVVTTWVVPTTNDGTGSGTPDALNATLNLTATGSGADGTFGTSDDQVATTTFTDAQLAVWAWRNQTGPTLNQWDAGTTIQQANSIYAEGEVIPFRWTSAEGGGSAPSLVENQTYTIQLDWAYAGGTTDPQKLFFDYLTSYDATESASAPFGPGSDLAGFQTGLVSTVSIPNDPGDTGGSPPNPPTVVHAAGLFTLYNINPATVTFGSYTADPVNSNQEDRRLNITFTVANDGDDIVNETMNVGVAWGGHLATQADYGFQNGAASFPGASPQMVVDFDPSTSGGASNVNINPNAIVPQGQITIIKDAIPDDTHSGSEDFGFTITGPNGANITPASVLDDDGDPTLPSQITFFGLIEGVYTITEDPNSRWDLSSISAIENGLEDTTTADIYSLNGRAITITVANGEVWSTTFTNTPAAEAPDPSLTIVKSLTDADDAIVDTAGETIAYTIVVDNTGNQDLSNVVLDDVFAGGAIYLSGDINTNSILETTETWTYSADYVVTQADLNAGTNLVNVAGVTTAQTARQTDDATSTVDQNPSLTIVKSLTDADDAIVDTAGETIAYTIVVDNTGNQDLSNVVLDDVFAGGAIYLSGDINTNSILETTETWTYSADYVVTQADLNAGTNLVNVAGVTTAQTARQTDDATSTVKTINVAQIAPTGTTCDQYIDGTAQDFSTYYAYQGGVIQYGVGSSGRFKDQINQTNPGVFFYYTGLSNTIKGTGGSSITVKIEQSNNGPDIAGDSTNTEWNFDYLRNDVKVYRVIDANENGMIDTNESCTKVNSGITIAPGTGADKGDVFVTITPEDSSLYVIGVKYDTGTVVGLNPSKPYPTVNYTFSTNVGNDDTIEETDTKGITLAPKAPLTLSGAATTGGAVLTQTQLAPVVNAAKEYWAAKGADVRQLQNYDVLIGDLGGTQLGAAGDSLITVDDNGAGHGWSTCLDRVAAGKVDLYSTVVHEFGHMLGYEHDVMGEELGLGERHLPFAPLSAQPNSMHSLLAV